MDLDKLLRVGAGLARQAAALLAARPEQRIFVLADRFRGGSSRRGRSHPRDQCAILPSRVASATVALSNASASAVIAACPRETRTTAP